MPDSSNGSPNTQPGQGAEYTETITVVQDTRRQRFVMAVILVLLILLLVGLIGSVVYLATPKGSRQVKAPSGITWVRSIYALMPGAHYDLNAPSDVAIDPSGGIWTTNGSVAVFGFHPDGQAKGVIIPPRQDVVGGFKTIEGLNVGPDGRIFVTDESRNRLLVFDKNRRFQQEVSIGYPIGVASITADKVAVTGAGGVAILGLSDTTPTILAKFGSRGKGPDDFDLPKSIAVGKDGTLYIADTENQRVSAYTQTGRRLWTTGRPVSQKDNAAGAKSPFQLPTGVTVDGNGRVIVTDAFWFKVYALDPKTGKITKSWGDYGNQDGYFSYPSAIKYDAARDWFVVADTANNRLQIIRIEGSGGSVLSTARRWAAYPWWACLIPLLLLLLALVIYVLRRRAEKAKSDAEEPSGDTQPNAH